MFGKDQKPRGLSRVKNILCREDWIHLLSLLVPLFVLDVAFKIVRITGQFGVSNPLVFLDQVRSEVLFCLGYGALWVGLFAAFRDGASRMVVLILFRVITIFVTALVVIAHFYYQTTGSPFDLSLIPFSIETLGASGAVIASETTALHWLLLVVLLLYTVAGPATLTRIFCRRWRAPARDSNAPRSRAYRGVLAASLALVCLSALPSVTSASSSFSRDAVVNMVVSRFQVAASPEVKTRLATKDLPTKTHLAPSPQTEKRNVALIFLESTRAQSTTPYNEDLKTTPYMDKLAKKSLVAERAYAVVPHTSKALVATTCGVAPRLDTGTTEAEPNAIPARCLPDLLKDQGYRSVFFQSATEEFERRREMVRNFGYNEFYPVESMPKEGFQKANYFGYEDNIMLDPSRKWLKINGDRGPFMASYLTVTPHHNYVVPDRYGKKEIVEDDLLNRYLNIMRYEDHFLKKLIRQYKQAGEYEDTVFVILGDHGEGFGEHGRYQHDDTIYNEGIKIPLIVHDPQNDSIKGKRIEPPVNEMDVLPTVTKLLGYDIRGGAYPGASITSPPKYRTLMASCYHEARCLASIRGDGKYIYHYGNQSEEFFELSEDPHEENNVAREHRKELKSRRKELLAWDSKVEKSYERQLSRQEEKTTPE